MINLTKIIAAILVLLAVALGVYAWVLSRQPAPVATASVPKATTTSKTTVQLFPVVVAAKPLPAGQVIPADSLRVERLSINPAGAFQDVPTAAGRVPVLDLAEGTPVMENQLVSGLALRVGEGERAVAIKADEVMGVGNRVQPGDFVDVFVMLKSDGKDVDRSQARLLLARKRVLAFGSASVESLPTRPGDKAADRAGATPQQAQQRAEIPRTAVLAVPVDEVNRLTIGDASGRLVLALRNPNDLSQPDPKLFAELPTALQPVVDKTAKTARAPLEGLDQAQAGLTAADLVTGGKGPGVRPPAAEMRAASNAPRAAGRSTGRGGLQVEVIRGEHSETVNY